MARFLALFAVSLWLLAGCGSEDAGSVDSGPDGNDGDGHASCLTDGECDDDDPCTVDACNPDSGCTHSLVDADNDGHADQSCGGDDCDDSDPGVAPGADEACNGLDDDCDGETDETFECVPGTTQACTTECGTVGSQDCDSACNLGTCCAAEEQCGNSCDDDCDGETDEGCECWPPGSTGDCATSCDSTGQHTCGEDAQWEECIPPVEECNGADDDCDTACDNGFDCCRGGVVVCTTTCGTTGAGSCTDACEVPDAAACTPPAEQCNGADDDCDGACDNGFDCCAGQAAACTTTCGSTGTGTCTQACLVSAPADCTPPSEQCNGADDDCDGACDNGFDCCAGQAAACTTTCGSTGSGTCTGTCAVPAAADCTPPAEQCNGADDDCDGTCDNGFTCCRDQAVPCTTTCGSTGTGTCTSACETPAPAACTPPSEECNGADDDCDGTCDDGFGCCAGQATPCTTTCGSTGTATCAADCTVPAPADCPLPPERCNDIDDNCDGATDEGPAATLCPPPGHVSETSCTAGACSIVSCDPDYYDVDLAYSDGCECQDQIVATDCSSGHGASPSWGRYFGTLPLPGMEDWYRVSFGFGGGVKILYLSTDPGDAYLFDVYNSCPGLTPFTCNWSTSGYTQSIGIDSFRMNETGGTYNTSPFCNVSTSYSTVYVRVRRTSPGRSCAVYALEVMER